MLKVDTEFVLTMSSFVLIFLDRYKYLKWSFHELLQFVHILRKLLRR